MFILIVFVDFDSDYDMSQFIIYFNELKEYCIQNESEFLFQYELCKSDKESNKIVIIEKYSDKQKYLDIHRNSTNFLKFKKNISNMKIRISGESFYM